MKPIKITKTIAQFGKLRIRFHVKFDGGHKEYDFNEKVYTALAYPSFVSLENVDIPDTTMNGVMITERNIFSALTATNKIIKNLCEHDIYATQRGNLIIYEDEAKKASVTTQLNGGGALLFKPSIVYDENDVGYEGAILFINNTNNVVNLTIDQLEGLRYCLSKIDFFVYSQLLVNYYISYYDINTNNPVSMSSKQKSYNKPQINWAAPQQEPKANATFSKGKDEFAELMGVDTM